MTSNEPRLDTTRLQKTRRVGSKITARCPACAATGADKSGTHLFINQGTGQFGCAAYPGDAEHRREIFRLVGIKGERRPDPERDRRWRQERDEELRKAEARSSLIEKAKSRRAAIIARHRWEPYDVWESSPQRIDCPLVESDPRHFLDSLFPQDAVVWTGETHQSGQDGRHADRWRTIADWQNAPKSCVGPMVSPSTWMPGATSRAADQVAGAPYAILDFDGLDGVAPKTEAEIQNHVLDSLAIIRWLREGLGWQLATIVWTGNKSLHAWFNTPPTKVLQSLRAIASEFGLDAGLIGRPEHPCRLPGQRHAKTGNLSRTIWLQAPLP